MTLRCLLNPWRFSLKNDWVPVTDYVSFSYAAHAITDYIVGYYGILRQHEYNSELPQNESENRYWKKSNVVVSFSWALHIEPWACVVNNSLAAAEPSSLFLKTRANREQPLISDVEEQYAKRIALTALQSEEPVGICWKK